jgi:L-Ala-D/L-Glu epimerase
VGRIITTDLVIRASVRDIAAPMRRAFGHARATRAVAEAIVVTIDWDGFPGAGECVPRDYVTGETVTTAFDALAALDIAALADRIDLTTMAAATRSLERLELPHLLRQGPHAGLAAACALELALLDSLARRFGTTLHAAIAALGLPPQLADDHTTAAPHQRSKAWDSTRTPEQLAEMFAPTPDFRVLKVKVGLGLDTDHERLRFARSAAPPDFTICVDANMAWSLDEACAMVEHFRPYNIAWYEEPLPRGALADYAQLRSRTGARVMLDESLCSFEQATAAVEHAACDLFNIRISKCGGVLASLRLVELAHRANLGYQLGAHPAEQCILRAAEWHLAGAIRGFAALELAVSNIYFEEELADQPLAFDGSGRCVPLTGPGLGVDIIPERLARWTRRTAER